MAMSVSWAEFMKEPWVNICWTEATLTPRPICWILPLDQ
jgi:hypothetical protein